MAVHSRVFKLRDEPGVVCKLVAPATQEAEGRRPVELTRPRPVWVNVVRPLL